MKLKIEIVEDGGVYMRKMAASILHTQKKDIAPYQKTGHEGMFKF